MRPIRLAALMSFVTILCPAMVIAETNPDLLFLRGLRKAGLADKAREYLDQKLIPDKALPKSLRDVLPLEEARTNLALAQIEVDDLKKQKYMSEARSKFTEFLKIPNHPDRPTANVELARLYALDAKNDNLRFLRLPSPNRDKPDDNLQKTISNAVTKARQSYLEADKKLREATVELEKQIKGGSLDEAAKKELQDEYLNALLERGKLIMDLAETFYVPEKGVDERINRTKYLEKNKNDKEAISAEAVFERIISEGKETQQASEARAYLNQVEILLDRGSKAIAERQALITDTKPANAGGRRIARFYDIKDSKIDSLRNKAIAWLRDYPMHHNTSEGIAVRFYYALATEQAAETAFKRDPKTREIISVGESAGPLLKEADTYFKQLMEFDNEYSERASRGHNRVILARAKIRSGDPRPEDLMSLEECALFSAVENAKRTAAIRDNPGSTDTINRKHYTQMVRFLERGIQVYNPKKDRERDLFDAQLALCTIYRLIDDPYSAAVMGEYIEQKYRGRFTKASIGGLLAMMSYQDTMVAADRRTATEDAKVDRARMIEIASLLDRYHGNSPYADQARHILASNLYAQQRYEEALNVYSRITKEYTSVYTAKREQGLAIYAILRAKGTDVTRWKSKVEETIEELKSLLPPGIGVDAKTAEAYCNAKLQICVIRLLQANLIFGQSPFTDQQVQQIAGHCDDAKTVAKALQEVFPMLNTLDDQKLDDFKARSREMQLNADYFVAFGYERLDAYAKVEEVLEPIIREIDARVNKKTIAPIQSTETKKTEPKKDPKKDLPKKDPPQKGMLNAETASSREGMGDKEDGEMPPRLSAAREEEVKSERRILTLSLKCFVQAKKIGRAREMLDLLRAIGGSARENVRVLQQVVEQVRNQYESLKKDKSKDRERSELKENFAAFLRNVGEGNQRAGDLLVVLGLGYSAISEYKEAAKFYEEYLKNENAPTDRTWQGVQLAYAYNLRMGGDLAKAETVMKEIMGTPAKQGWGYLLVETNKEYLYLLEDQKRWRDATNGWNAQVKKFQSLATPRKPTEVRLSEVRKQFDKRPDEYLKAMEKQFANAAKSDEYLRMIPADDELEEVKNDPKPIEAEKRLKDRYRDQKIKYLENVMENVFNREMENSGKYKGTYLDFFYESQRCYAKAFRAIYATRQMELSDKLRNIADQFVKLEKANPGMLEMDEETPEGRVGIKVRDFLMDPINKDIRDFYQQLGGTLIKNMIKE